MRYGSVCAGIEAATTAWHPLGWEPVWFSEIEPFPCKVLQHHYPNIPNLGDMTKLHEKEIFLQEPIDLLVGGTPCQSFSIAGLRGGLADSRGNLALEFCRILKSKQPKWFVWENVPGVLSSKRGADLRSIFKGFQACGYSFAWRVLDAQYFGVPQRRNRIFVVGHLGDDWRPPAAVLFEPQGLRRHPKKGRKAGEIVAALTKNGVGASGADDNQGQAGHIISHPLHASGHRRGEDGSGVSTPIIVHALTGNGHDASEDGTGRGIPLVYATEQITSKLNGCNPKPGDPSHPLNSSGQPPLLVAGTLDASYARHKGTSGQDACHGHSTLVTGFQSSQSGVRLIEVFGTLDANNGPRRQNGIITDSVVRRLTPLECERLQGFPDGYTAIAGAKDSPRYASIGNSMARPVMAWIGKRIDYVDKEINNA